MDTCISKLTAEDVQELNERYYRKHPEERGLKWSGCEFYVNNGIYDLEPIGTAQAMRSCLKCKKFETCDNKKDHPIWIIEL